MLGALGGFQSMILCGRPLPGRGPLRALREDAYAIRIGRRLLNPPVAARHGTRVMAQKEPGFVAQHSLNAPEARSHDVTSDALAMRLCMVPVLKNVSGAIIPSLAR